MGGRDGDGQMWNQVGEERRLTQTTWWPSINLSSTPSQAFFAVPKHIIIFGKSSNATVQRGQVCVRNKSGPNA